MEEKRSAEGDYVALKKIKADRPFDKLRDLSLANCLLM
jgi:hypothetical protein